MSFTFLAKDNRLGLSKPVIIEKRFQAVDETWFVDCGQNEPFPESMRPLRTYFVQSFVPRQFGCDLCIARFQRGTTESVEKLRSIALTILPHRDIDHRSSSTLPINPRWLMSRNFKIDPS